MEMPMGDEASMSNNPPLPNNDANSASLNAGISSNGAVPPMDGADPSMDGADPSMSSAEGMESDVPMGGEEPLDSAVSNNPKVKYVQDLISQLGDADLNAAEGYVESLTRDNDSAESDNAQDEPSENQMMETVIFSKRQLKHINEVFGQLDNDETEKPLEKKTKSNVSKKSPFNTPFV